MHKLLSFILLPAFGLQFANLTAEPLLDPIPASIEFGTAEVKLTEISTGMISPLHGTYAPGDTSRLFVVDQLGVVYAIDLATGEKTEFLNLADRVLVAPNAYDEKGFLGLAFHPSYQSNGLIYTYTSEETAGEADFPWDLGFTFGPHQSVINEWQVNNPLNTAEVVDPDSAREVMRIDQPTGFHNGGALAFDLQGYLLIALGNGGPLTTGQDNSLILGSILRIVPNADYAPVGNHAESANGEYLLPESNPFVDDPDALDEIFAHGFRNPYRLSVDRVSNDIYAGDVGNNDIEEVDLVTAGNNYGFAIKEGSFCFVGAGGPPDGSPGVEDPAECADISAGLIDPIAEYDHDEGVAVIGGYVYRGAVNDSLSGRYIFSDYNGRLLYLDDGELLELKVNGPQQVAGRILGMAEDASGELYLLVNDTGRTTGNTGRLLRIDQAEPIDTALDNWSAMILGYHAVQGIGPTESNFIQPAMEKFLTAVESGDPAEIEAAVRLLNSIINAINWGRNNWGNPVLTDAQADILIAATQAILDEMPEFLTSGLRTMQSNGVERSYYLQLPSDYTSTKGDKPAIVGFHGSFASHRSWVSDSPSYTFVDVVADGAVMAFPDALPLGEGAPNWNFEYDFLYFADLVKELRRLGVAYDPNRLFVTGHSSGGGMAQEVGCRFGDIVRAIAVSSGSLISSQCTGSIGVIQSQGEVDAAVPLNIGEGAHTFWSLYNGWDIDMSIDTESEPCIDHSLLPLGSADYPVRWCQHPGGHAWPDFASEAFWEFFAGLPIAEPTPDAPAGGGNEAVLADAISTISFSLTFPEDMGNTIGGAITLYPPNYCAGLFAAPSIFLNLNWFPGAAAPGSTVTYENVPIYELLGTTIEAPADYKLQVSIYNEGGSQPIPTPGIDHMVVVPLRIEDRLLPIVLDEPLQVEVVGPILGACPAD